MKFSAREDIEAPIDHVFAAISDFEGFEREAATRGADVQRLPPGAPIAVGSQWDVSFQFRGRKRKFRGKLAQADQQAVRFETVSPGLESVLLIELVALSPSRTRVAVSIDLQAQSLTARLMLQSLKLAKANLDQRFKTRVATRARQIEESFVA